MGDNGSAEGVDPVVAESAEVTAVTPGCLVPELEGDVREGGIGSPGIRRLADA